jgi:hypothetical protein
MDENLIYHLHDRFTRGEVLSEQELHILQAWYGQQDTEEDAYINRKENVADTSMQIQQQIKHTALQLQTVTQQISATIAANETIRAEIIALQARLAQQAPGRAA